MASLKPLFETRRRTDFGGYPEQPYGGGANNHHDYNYQAHPVSHTKPAYDYTYQTPSYTHSSPPQLHHSKPSVSPPVILDDGAAATIEWKETPEAHIFKTHIPTGVRREDVRVQIEDDSVLKIIGERVAEAAEDRLHGGWRVVEVSRGRFVTSLKLPEDSRADLIKSYWENGALTVKIPRREVTGHHHVRNVDIIDHRY